MGVGRPDACCGGHWLIARAWSSCSLSCSVPVHCLAVCRCMVYQDFKKKVLRGGGGGGGLNFIMKVNLDADGCGWEWGIGGDYRR